MEQEKKDIQQEIDQFNTKNQADLKKISQMFLDLAMITRKLDCLASGRNYLLPNPKFVFSITYPQMKGILVFFPLKELLQLRLVHSKFNQFALASLKDRLQLIEEASSQTTKQVEETQEKLKQLETPESLQEIDEHFKKVQEQIGKLEPKDFTELLANKNPQTVVGRVLYTMLQLLKENVRVFEIDLEEKAADPEMWAYIKSNIAQNFLVNLQAWKQKIFEQGISEKHYLALKQVEDVTVENSKKVSNCIAGMIEIIKQIQEMHDKYELLREKGKSQNLFNQEKKLNLQISSLKKILKM